MPVHHIGCDVPGWCDGVGTLGSGFALQHTWPGHNGQGMLVPESTIGSETVCMHLAMCDGLQQNQKCLSIVEHAILYSLC